MKKKTAKSENKTIKKSNFNKDSAIPEFAEGPIPISDFHARLFFPTSVNINESKTSEMKKIKIVNKKKKD